MTFNEKREAFLEALDEAANYCDANNKPDTAATLWDLAPDVVRKRMPGNTKLWPTSKSTRFAEMLRKGPVHVDEVYHLFGWGRKEARDNVAYRRSVARDPDDMQWIRVKDDHYVLIGTGPNPPKGWRDKSE